MTIGSTSPYINAEQAFVQRWSTDRNSLGCAKLYRAGTYYDAVGLMKYNRDYGAESGLYLSGESFSVDAGWTEVCLRGAIDAVIHICNKTGADFNGGFSMTDYPHYRAAPMNTVPRQPDPAGALPPRMIATAPSGAVQPPKI